MTHGLLHARAAGEAYAANLLASDLLGLGVLPVVLDPPRPWEELNYEDAHHNRGPVE